MVPVEERSFGHGSSGLIHLDLSSQGAGPAHILCLGAHSDDIEIGCGGTVLRLAEQYPDCMFHWVVFSDVGHRQEEALRGAGHFVKAKNLKGPILKNFQDGFLPFVGAEVKKVFEDLKQNVVPDVI